MAKGIDNLIPMNKRTVEEQREIARRGGIASGEARREKATLKKALEQLLDEKCAEEDITYRNAATLGLIRGAIDGKAENYKVIAQVLGELDEPSNIDTPIVNINVVDNTELEKALYEDNN